MLKNVGATWGKVLVSILLSYILTPFIISTLGQERYGAWVLINSIMGYLAILALGVPAASVRYLSEALARKDLEDFNRTSGACGGLYVVLGGAALVATLPLFLFFTTYDLDAAVRADAYLAFVLVGAASAVGFYALLPAGILSAKSAFVALSGIQVFTQVLRFAVTIVGLRMEASIALLAAIQVGLAFVEFIVSAMYLRRTYPEIRLGRPRFDPGRIRKIFSFSVYVLLLSLGLRLHFQTDAIVIGGLLDVREIPYFDVANSLLLYLMEFVVAIGAVLMPAASRHGTLGEWNVLRDLYFKWAKIAVSLTCVAALYLMVFGPAFIGRWIGPSFTEPAGLVLRILVVANLLFLPARGVAIPLLLGIGQARVAMFSFAGFAILNLVASLALARPLGLAGVAIGTAVPIALFAVHVLAYAARKVQARVGSFFLYVFGRNLLALGAGLLILRASQVWFDMSGYPGLVAAGFFTVGLAAVLWVGFVHRRDPHLDLFAEVRARLGRGAA